MHPVRCPRHVRQFQGPPVPAVPRGPDCRRPPSASLGGRGRHWIERVVGVGVAPEHDDRPRAAARVESRDGRHGGPDARPPGRGGDGGTPLTAVRAAPSVGEAATGLVATTQEEDFGTSSGTGGEVRSRTPGCGIGEQLPAQGGLRAGSDGDRPNVVEEPPAREAPAKHQQLLLLARRAAAPAGDQLQAGPGLPRRGAQELPRRGTFAEICPPHIVHVLAREGASGSPNGNLLSRPHELPHATHEENTSAPRDGSCAEEGALAPRCDLADHGPRGAQVLAPPNVAQPPIR
mmetsp:Transcript_162140/g.519971  ORF Transcript_162140/g.519971 Transcript_162140/m.519971 type:complete len:290 (-) Transcript_162140:1269-2138(-)